MPERMGAEQRLPDPMVECCASDTLNYFSHELKACPNSASAGEDISACSRPRGNRNGRKLGPALMWRRVHNRNCDRGSKPVRRLRAARTSAPGPSGGPRALPPRRDARRQTAAYDEPGLSRDDVCFIVGACAGGHFALPWHAGPGLCAVDHIAGRGVAVDHRKMSGCGVNSSRDFSTARTIESECTLVLARSLADFIGARVTAPWRTEAERAGRPSRPDQWQEALLPPPEQAALPQQSAAACPPARPRAYRPSHVSRGP